MKNLLKKATLVLMMMLTLTLGIAIGGLGRSQWLAMAAERYEELQIFTKVLNLVQQYYVETVDTRKLIYGGIKGMLLELDPHTNFLPPEMFKEFESETSGEFGGLGVEITVQNDILTVISPIEDTPAWEAGIKAGDKIVEINGESTKGLSLAEAAQKMRGKMGSAVRMGIYREGFDKPKEFVVKRAVVKVKSTKFTDLGEGYGYFRLTSFIENTSIDFNKFLNQMKNAKAGIKGIIIDLRRNPGGLLDQAIKVSDLFLDHGVIVSTMGRNKREKEIVYAKKDGTFSGFPVVVLLNEYSASASEILAGALQDNKRALIMGQRTFGKGSVQSVVKLGDGSGLKLTVARYYTPSGKSIQAEGIKPDIVLEDVDAEGFKKAIIKRDARREQDMARHLLGDKEKKEIEKNQANEEQGKKSHSEVSFWWRNDESDKKTELTPKEKLLTNDYQILQAYNYVKAWSLMDEFSKVAEPTADAKSSEIQVK